MATKKSKKQPKKIILLVEDEDVLLAAILERLEAEGFVVFGVASAQKALDLVKVEQPDLIMTDIIMQPIDGIELLKRLKDDTETADIPTIVLSNSDDEQHMTEAERLGTTEFIVKADHSLEEVTEKVKSVLEG